MVEDEAVILAKSFAPYQINKCICILDNIISLEYAVSTIYMSTIHLYFISSFLVHA